MTAVYLRTIPADYRQLVAQLINLDFVVQLSCAIVSKPATVPSSSTAGFDKTCYPSPKGRLFGKPEEPPFFHCDSADARTAAHFLIIGHSVSFRRFRSPIESRHPNGKSKGEIQKMRAVTKFAIATSLALGLSACVSSDLERAGVGAAVGAGAAVVLDTNPITGAVVGAAAGALCDDLTNLC